MAFSERVKVFIDVVADGATSSLKNFRAAISQAEGATGKFKAGAKSAMDSVKANAGTMALAAGASLIAFGVKAVGAFTSTAKAALDLSTATGLTVEEASRWIAVGDDFEVGAEALQTGLGKIAKTMDATKWAEYGIATRDAGGNARGVNDILLDTFDKLSSIENQTERARIGQELFGKGYQSLTPILGKTRAEYEKMLATQSDGQVITESEAKKAEKMRLAQDALKDAFGDVTLAVGSAVAEMAPMIELMSDLVSATIPAFEAIGTLAEGIKAVDWSDPIGGIDPLKQWATNAEIAAMTLEQVTATVEDSSLSIAAQNAYLEAWNKYNGEVTTSSEEVAKVTALTAEEVADLAKKERGLTGDTRKAKEAMEGLATSTAAAEREFSDLLGELDRDDAWLGLLDNIDAYKLKMEDSEATDREKVQATNDMKRSLIEYTLTLKEIPQEQKTEVLALIDEGKLDEANYILGALTAARNVLITPIVGRGANGNFTITANNRSAVGSSAGGGVTMVGETGPELVNLPRFSQVKSANQTEQLLNRGTGGSYVDNRKYFYNLPAQSAESLYRELERHKNRNGLE